MAATNPEIHVFQLSGFYPPNFWTRIGLITSPPWNWKNVKLHFDCQHYAIIQYNDNAEHINVEVYGYVPETFNIEKKQYVCEYQNTIVNGILLSFCDLQHQETIIFNY